MGDIRSHKSLLVDYALFIVIRVAPRNNTKPCPHWRLVAKFGDNLSPNSATVAVFGDTATVAEFGDSRQCGQGFIRSTHHRTELVFQEFQQLVADVKQSTTGFTARSDPNTSVSLNHNREPFASMASEQFVVQKKA